MYIIPLGLTLATEAKTLYPPASQPPQECSKDNVALSPNSNLSTCLAPYSVVRQNHLKYNFSYTEITNADTLQCIQ